jgi:3,4-dihydroxy 2-butanone 4-phosphate synthase/GTP cyclohydrolase II
LSTLKILETVQLPTDHGDFIMSIISYGDDLEHIVLERSSNASEIPFIRIHSECMTGDVFRSHRCDCGEQLEKSLKKIGQTGHGFVFYLRQEGRGIGLLNKMKAYNLQEQGYDTAEANEKLGFDIDLREYDIVASFLKSKDVKHVKLITNNPEKCDALRDGGIEVDRIPLPTTTHNANERYKSTKMNKLGHYGH